MKNNEEFIVRRSRPLGSKKNPRYVIAESKSQAIVDDARGYGYKSEKSAVRGWAMKNKQTSVEKRRESSRRSIESFFEKHPGLEEEIQEFLFLLFKFDEKIRTRDIINEFPDLDEIDELKDGFTVVELLNYV